MDYAFDRDFHAQLKRKLEHLVFTQQLRSRIYGTHVAEDYPISHTPIEVKEQYLRRKEEDLEDLEAPTPEEEEVLWNEKCFVQHTYGNKELDTPPSNNSTPLLLRSNGKSIKRHVPVLITHHPHTPPLSSEEESPALSPTIKTVPAHMDSIRKQRSSGRKRSYRTAMEDDCQEQQPRVRRRRVATMRRSTALR